MRKFFSVLRFVVFAILLVALIAMGAFVPMRTIFQQADLTPAPVLMSHTMSATPKSRLADLQTSLYGRFIMPTTFEMIDSQLIGQGFLSGKAITEQRRYRVGYGGAIREFDVIIVTPKDKPNASIILSQNFSANNAVIAEGGISPVISQTEPWDGGMLGGIFKYFFGRYIQTPPLEDIIDHGYAFVAMHPPDVVPDHSERGMAALAALFPAVVETERPGALSVWASLSVALADDLKQDQPNRPIISLGHSRYGKTALLAAAFGDSIDGAIAHQSGTAGASLMRDNTGESLRDVIQAYPHWLGVGAKDYIDTPRAMPVDAPDLLAAIAPKPILLGNARRDVWSDPEGAFQAAKMAAPAWGKESFTAPSLDTFIPEDKIAFWTRPGTHGVVKEDWPAFLDFLDAQF